MEKKNLGMRFTRRVNRGVPMEHKKISGRRPPKSMLLIYSAVSLALVLLMAGVSMTAPSPDLPVIAEFAPEAVAQTEQAPDTPELGDGASGQPSAGASAPVSGSPSPSASSAGPSESPSQSESPSPTPTDEDKKGEEEENRTLQCAGTRQTEDPQSAPCLDFWKNKAAGNGGKTWNNGVSGDDIRIGVGVSGAADTKREQSLAGYFNNHYMFYGRKLTVVDIKVPPGLEVGDPNAAASFAADAQAAKVFAVIDPAVNAADLSILADALADKKIISIQAGNKLGSTKSDMNNAKPYQWSFNPPVDTTQAALGSFVCEKLAGQNAVFGGKGVQDQKRKVGILQQQNNSGDVVEAGPLVDALNACGVPTQTAVVMVNGTTVNDAAMNTAITKFRNDKVTSIVSLGGNWLQRGAMSKAQVIGDYEPEWLLGSFANQMDLKSWSMADAEQKTHAFGIWADNGSLDADNTGFMRAMLEMDKSFTLTGLSGRITGYQLTYQAMMLLANGVQQAGPELNPTNFSKGLFTAEFPNPNQGGAPYFQGGYGFGNGDYSALDDFGVFWYYPEGQTKDPNGSMMNGKLCFVDNGRRFSPGGWPAGDRVNPANTC